MDEPLAGGMGNQGQVVRVGGAVRRPRGPHADAIAALLGHLERAGFPAPVRTAVEGDTELFRWIEGAVPVPPYPAWALTDEALASVGRLLRRYHDAVASFVPPAGATWSRELCDPRGGPIVCHGDVCPENVVFQGTEAVALLDFDFAAPGHAAWDLASTARLWVPLRPPIDGDERDGLDRLARLRVLTDAYALAAEDRGPLVDAIVEGRRVGTAFVTARVQAGQPAFIEMFEQQGGAEGQAMRIAWLDERRAAFLAALGG